MPSLVGLGCLQACLGRLWSLVPVSTELSRLAVLCAGVLLGSLEQLRAVPTPGRRTPGPKEPSACPEDAFGEGLPSFKACHPPGAILGSHGPEEACV